jgi:uncharacterized protein YbjT (DUF2867 family)
MKVLVTGGTGFVGSEVVRQLHRAGHSPRLLVRNSLSRSVRELVTQFSVEIFPGNVLDVPPLNLAMKGCDAAIHLVGIISEAGEQIFENLHTRATKNVVNAAKTAGVKRFIHMSALGTRPNAVARYHQTKWAAEEIARSSGLDWTIFRPSIIYGPGDGFVNLFASMSRWSPVIPLVGGGISKFQPVPVGNVARSFVASLKETGSIGRTLDLCGDEVMTLRQIVEAVLAATRRRRLMLPLPFGVADIQAAAAEFCFARVLGKPPPLNRDQLLMLREDNVGDGSEANKLFGLHHTAFADGISRYLKR